MQFRYREMVYRPEFYDFHNDDREEWFPNGIFNYNVSRLIKDLSVCETDRSNVPWLHEATKASIPVKEILKYYSGWERLEEEHIAAAVLKRPLIFVELAPDSFNLIDGHHRIAKAIREGVDNLPAWMVGAHSAIRYLGREFEYCRYTEYWNSKIEEIRDLVAYRGWSCYSPAPLLERDLDANHIWNRMCSCLNESRRVELYSEGQWFTLFRLAGKLFCGEAEEHSPSIRCAAPFRITVDMVENANTYFEDWSENVQGKNKNLSIRKEIRKVVRHADVLMACIRVFSEY